MSLQFTKAVKTKQYLRLAIDGISGSGKTYTALATAAGMAEATKGNVALIDSEHGSASLYADRFEFDTLDLTEFQIENYIDALKAAAENGYNIVIIDSTSHAWDALVERIERTAHHKFSGNTFRAWAEGTPLQKKLIEAMLSYPGHVIVTCRSKTEYSVDKNDKGKTEIKKVGTSAVQRQGFEYEFTMAMTMDGNHVGYVSKDRTGEFQDKYIEKPGVDFGKKLIAWLSEGSEMKAPEPPKPEQKAPENKNAGKPADKPKSERQKIIDRIVVVLIAKTPDSTDFFSDEERSEIKETIKNTAELSTLEDLAIYLEKKYAERVNNYVPIPFGDDDDDLSALTSKEETSAKTQVETAETQTETTTAEKTEEIVDDGFVDDLPDNPKGKGKKKAELELDTLGAQNE